MRGTVRETLEETGLTVIRPTHAGYGPNVLNRIWHLVVVRGHDPPHTCGVRSQPRWHPTRACEERSSSMPGDQLATGSLSDPASRLGAMTRNFGLPSWPV